MKRIHPLKRLLWIAAFVFLIMNLVAGFHAYTFTHFTDRAVEKTSSSGQLSAGQKIKTVLLGINNPRPFNTTLPMQPFTTVYLQSNKRIECWSIPCSKAKGTVILFHGYGGQKSSMLGKSDLFLQMGYNTLLVDFMGSGGSEGNQTTIGVKEAEEVKTSFDYLQQKGENNIILFGTSMGAVAILKAVHEYQLQPAAIIIECPFASMYQTTCARFRALQVPCFPMAGLLDFWGGIENGFWAFGHQPVEYAKSVHCPALLLWGEKDPKVSRQETEDIFTQLAGKKQLKTYPLAAHENYLLKYKPEWTADISGFLQSIKIIPPQ